MNTNEERLNYLIDVLKNETEQYKNLETPKSIEDKKYYEEFLLN